MEHQAGARHLADVADVAGTFSGPEWAPKEKPAEPERKEQDYPLWRRAEMDAETQVLLLQMWGKS